MNFPTAWLNDCLGDARIVLVTGHYGSGKTEFAVNLALHAADCDQKLALADLDIVNPYFRSRERRRQLEEKGIRLIASSQACTNADVPALPADVFATLQDASLCSVYDVGGDAAGARVLARFRPQILALPHEMLFVLNANRPETATAELALAYMKDIERTSGIPVTGIVNNTHLCGETDTAQILKGAKLADEVSALTKLPVVCHVAVKTLCGEKALAHLTLFPIDIYMKKPWE